MPERQAAEAADAPPSLARGGPYAETGPNSASSARRNRCRALRPRVLTEPGRLSPDVEKDRLRHVFNVVPVLQNPGGDASAARPVAPTQLGVGLLVTGCDPLNAVSVSRHVPRLPGRRSAVDLTLNGGQCAASTSVGLQRLGHGHHRGRPHDSSGWHPHVSKTDGSLPRKEHPTQSVAGSAAKGG